MRNNEMSNTIRTKETGETSAKVFGLRRHDPRAQYRTGTKARTCNTNNLPLSRIPVPASRRINDDVRQSSEQDRCRPP